MDKRPVHIVLFGLFGANNIGNNATLSVMVRRLRHHLPDARISCACLNPSVVANEHRIAAVPIDLFPPKFVWRIRHRGLRRLATGIMVFATEISRRRRTYRFLHDVDHFVIVGTGALDDFTTQPWESPLDLFRWCRAARRRDVAVHFVSVGAGPIHNVVSRWLIKKAVSSADFRSYRDDLSKNYLRGIGVDSSNDGVWPDLVFDMSTEPVSDRMTPSNPPKEVGVGVMGYKGWKNNRNETGQNIFRIYIEKIAKFVSWLLSEGYTVRLLTGETGTDDRAVQEVLETVASSRGSGDSSRLCAVTITSIGDLLHQISLTDVVVATRFHNVLCSLLLNRPVVSIGYSKKNDALLAEMGLSEYCQEIETLDVKHLIEQFRSVTERHAALSRNIARVNLAYRRRLDESFHSTLDRMKAGVR